MLRVPQQGNGSETESDRKLRTLGSETGEQHSTEDQIERTAGKKRARAVKRLRIAGRGTFLSKPNAMIIKTATITRIIISVRFKKKNR
jgi:hypothetical protein